MPPPKLVLDIIAALKNLWRSFIAGFVFYLGLPPTTDTSVTPSEYQTLKTSHAPVMESAPAPGQGAPQEPDDLECGILPPPTPVSSFMMSPYLGYQDAHSASSSVYSPTLSGTSSPSSTGPSTPTLTSSVLSPYILHHGRISLLESAKAKAMLFSQSWAPIPFSGSEDLPQESGIQSLPTDSGFLKYCPQFNPDQHRGPQSLFPPTTGVTLASADAVDGVNLASSGNNHYPNSLGSPPPTSTPHSGDSLLEGKVTHHDVQRDQPNDRRPSPQMTDCSMLAFSASSFLSIPDLTLVSGDDVENAKLPSSFSAPELRYLMFYYEHYCREPSSLGEATIHGVNESSQEVPNASRNQEYIDVPQTEVAEDTTMAAIDPEEFDRQASTAPSFLVPSASSIPVIPPGPKFDPSYSDSEETGKESSSTGPYTSSSEDDTSSVSPHDVTFIQARRGSVTQPVFFLRVPGTRESVRLRVVPSNHACSGSPSATGSGRNRSGTNDTQFTSSTISRGATPTVSYLSAGESSETGSDAESVSTSPSLEVENGSEDKSDGSSENERNSDNDEVEAQWITWHRGKAMELHDRGTLSHSSPKARCLYSIFYTGPDPRSSTLSSGSGTVTLFNDNHRQPISIAPATRQSAPQSNLRELMVSRINDPLPINSTEDRKHNARRQSLSILRTSILVQTENSVAAGDLVGLTFADTRYPLFATGPPCQPSIHSYLSRAMTIASLAPSSLSRSSTKEGSSHGRNRGREKENTGASARRTHYRKRAEIIMEQQQSLGVGRRNGVDLRDLGFGRPESVFYAA
ncbi:hypothetical protein EST38_g7981 [Candolleomyces aberdarensis]|uniref:Uncharacterized protein n=1 Tax=Candolleomyces aberdarensis TaxID=2316362 RepID=A0A4V1Q3A2_9AGAR|nr:hypothetical protein EST38_g7981 [Candolleomyces aberdarensis]